jgi:Fe-S-cluster-containing hydrogenase component 2
VYGRLKREKEKAPYKRLACNHCNRTLTAHNHRLFHGDNCKQNPANVHALEEKLRKAEEKKLREKLKRLRQKNEASSLKCQHCGYETRD